MSGLTVLTDCNLKGFLCQSASLMELTLLLHLFASTPDFLNSGHALISQFGKQDSQAMRSFKTTVVVAGEMGVS